MLPRASPLLLSSLLPPVPPFPLLLSSFTFLCTVVLPTLFVSSFAIFVFPASLLLPFVAFDEQAHSVEGQEREVR
jgi:hypothetical protein